MLCETIELRVPERVGVCQPAADRVEGRGVELTMLDTAVFHRGDKPGGLQDTQMLQHRRHRHVERLGKLGHRRLAPGQPGQHGTPRRIGERAKHGVQMSLFTCQLVILPAAAPDVRTGHSLCLKGWNPGSPDHPNILTP